MTKRLGFLSLALVPCFPTSAHARETAKPHVPQASNLNVSVDLLSDAGPGVDPYLKNLLSNLRQHWAPLAADAENQSVTTAHETLINLTIAPSGQILALQLENPAQNIALDQAAWGAAVDTPYSPPPTGMKDVYLKLRVHFLVD